MSEEKPTKLIYRLNKDGSEEFPLKEEPAVDYVRITKMK